MNPADYEVVDGCWIWTGSRHARGWPRIIDKNGNHHGAHRVAYEEAHGPIPDGNVVYQSCGHKLCVNPDHLEVGTRANLDRSYAVGEQHGKSKLTEHDVHRIRLLLSLGLNDREVVEHLDLPVDQRGVASIRRGRTWSWLKEEPMAQLHARVWLPAPEGTVFAPGAADRFVGSDVTFDGAPARIIEAAVVDKGRHISAVFAYDRGATNHAELFEP